jgi:vancomycin resistance protein YoaR
LLVAILSYFGLNVISSNRHHETVYAVGTEEEAEPLYDSMLVRAARESDVAYDNIFVNGTDVGGLTKEQVNYRLKEEFFSNLEGQELVLTDGQQSANIGFLELNLTPDFSGAVEEAFDFTREGTNEDIYDRITRLNNEPLQITYEPDFTYEIDEVERVILELSEAINSEPINATSYRGGEQVVITEEILGKEVDVDGSVANVRQLIPLLQSDTAYLAVTNIYPEILAEDLHNGTPRALMGSFTTTYTGEATDPRNVNIANAVSKINGWELAPNEIFSVYHAFGIMTEENGYRIAAIVVGNELAQGIGGGVCQVVSTIYNAVLRAELEVVERGNHTMMVTYVEWGFDATLAGTWIDFRFRNDTNYPVIMEASAEDGVLTVDLFGYKETQPGRRISFFASLNSVFEAGETFIYDPNLPYGKVIVREGQNGHDYDVFKNIYYNDVLVETVFINNSIYTSADALIRVGTGPADMEISEGYVEEIIDDSYIMVPPPARELIYVEF